MVGKGLDIRVVLELMFYASATFFPLALPLSVLLSTIMAFGKLSETYELVAFKSAGVSLLRVMLPLISVVLLICGIAFVFANNFIPKANLKFHSLLFDIRAQRPSFDIKEGQFYSGIDGYVIRISHKVKNSKIVKGVMIYDHTANKGSNIVLTADSGILETGPNQQSLNVLLYHGHRYEEMESNIHVKSSFPLNRQYFESYNLKFDLTAFKLSRTKEELFKNHWEMLNINQLQDYTDSMNRVIDTNLKNVPAFARPFINFYADPKFYTNYKPIPQIPTYKSSYLELTKKESHKSTLEIAMVNSRSLKQLMEEQATALRNNEELRARFEIEWHRKFSLSLACLTLFFIGAPLGAIIRKGGLGMPTVVAIFMFLIFYVLNITFEKSAKQVSIDALSGMWIPTLILMPIGLYLTYKANNDSISFAFFDKLAWKIGKLFKRKKV